MLQACSLCRTGALLLPLALDCGLLAGADGWQPASQLVQGAVLRMQILWGRLTLLALAACKADKLACQLSQCRLSQHL